MQKPIFIIDDDRDDLALLIMSFLKRAPDFRLVPFNNTRIALATFEDLKNNELPAMFIIDLNMPGINGFQVLEILNTNEKYKEIPKVMFSSSDLKEHKQRAFDHGAIYFFTKPFDMSQMNQMIDQMIGCLHEYTY